LLALELIKLRAIHTNLKVVRGRGRRVGDRLRRNQNGKSPFGTVSGFGDAEEDHLCRWSFGPSSSNGVQSPPRLLFRLLLVRLERLVGRNKSTSCPDSLANCDSHLPFVLLPFRLTFDFTFVLLLRIDLFGLFCDLWWPVKTKQPPRPFIIVFVSTKQSLPMK
jgi:hypothetical protein